ncbi:MAG: prephenate dehydrogenase [Gemmatimonadetes bacterium]|nr:prephenate dehydrogenase [Gemmatimonadota bacterium]
MGGSLARDLAARGVAVRAYDSDASHLAAALRDGVVTEALDASLAGVRGADAIVVAVPVDAAVEVLHRIAPYAGTARLITDVGSTKTRILEAAHSAGLGARFVGSHPMAGDHRSGWEASRTGLFAGACVYLCPSPETRGDVDLATTFWTELGARIEVLPADEHDRKLAWSSHLPHMVSVGLALALARTGVERDDLGPGGRDVTRLAGSSPEVWTAIARDNAVEIDAALAAAQTELEEIRDALRRADDDELRARFARARTWFTT